MEVALSIRHVEISDRREAGVRGLLDGEGGAA